MVPKSLAWAQSNKSRAHKVVSSLDKHAIAKTSVLKYLSSAPKSSLHLRIQGPASPPPVVEIEPLACKRKNDVGKASAELLPKKGRMDRSKELLGVVSIVWSDSILYKFNCTRKHTSHLQYSVCASVGRIHRESCLQNQFSNLNQLYLNLVPNFKLCRAKR